MGEGSGRAGLPKLLTAEEVAEQLGFSLAQVYRMARNGHLPSVRLGRAVRFAPDAVQKWIDQGGTGGQS